MMYVFEASRSGGAHANLWVRFPFEKIKCLIFSFLRSGYKIKARPSSATQCALPLEFGEIWGKEVSSWKRSVLTLGVKVSSAYRA